MEILGIRIDNLTQKEVLEKVDDFLLSNQQHYIVTPNPEFLILAQKDTQFKAILNQADIAVPDGIGLVWASTFLGSPLKERVTGVDLMELICQQAALKKWPVFLLGGRNGAGQKAVDVLKKKYPGLRIDASETTLFGQPTIIFVALGAGKQERWIVNNLRNIPSVKLAMGVGGAFDFIAGRVKRAPRLFQRAGLEWFWRLMLQPWRIRRIINAVIRFPWLVLKSKYLKQ